MDEQSQQPTPDNSKNTFESGKFSTQTDNPGEEKGNGTKQGDSSQQIETKPRHTTKNGAEKNWWGDNWEKALSVGIQAILAFFTYLLWQQASTQSKAAIEAANAAKDAVKQYERANDIARATFESNNESSKATFDLSKQSLKEQVNSLKETQKEFEKDNRPYIEGLNFKVEQCSPNNKIILTYALINMGKQPIKTIKGKFYYFNGPKMPENPFDSLRKHDVEYSFLNTYISKESPNGGRFTSFNEASSLQIFALQNRLFHLYFWGEVTYQNLVTNKYRRYRFEVKFNYPDDGWDILYNENEEIKK